MALTKGLATERIDEKSSSTVININLITTGSEQDYSKVTYHAY